MALKQTNLYIQMAPIPATFKGSPQDFSVAMVQRMKILSPNGTNFIFIGDVEPTSNVGPWLRGGTQWWVWDDNIKRYVPLDISASTTIPFFIGASTPGSTPPQVWLKTTQDATDLDPSHGSPITWMVFDGTNWVPFNSVTFSGPTTSRPAAPQEYQQFFDTDISVLIWWERGAWRTVSGVPGDVKHVIYEILTDALRFNPGWAVLGASNQTWRGRLIVQAAQDGGGNPQTVLTVGPNIAQRAALETFGEDQGLTANNASTLRYPGTIALWTLVKT
jgi:hypothetical protein